jgi:5-methylcytosine-specific restriction endonuclease McrA
MNNFIGRPKAGTIRHVIILCEICKKPIKKYIAQLRKTHNFCSYSCYGKYRKGKKFHSDEMYKALGNKFLGENNPNWKGGVFHNKLLHKIWINKHRDSVNQRNANRRAKLRNISGKFTLKEWQELKIQHNYTCKKCAKKEPEIKLTRDHIIPISKGGTNLISNIQPLCLKCNSSKKDNIPNPDSVFMDALEPLQRPKEREPE